jgi:hypothetical protein
MVTGLDFTEPSIALNSEDSMDVTDICTGDELLFDLGTLTLLACRPFSTSRSLSGMVMLKLEVVPPANT